MSTKNVEIVRRANAAFNRRDRDAAFADFHPDVEWRDLQHAADAPECVHGRSALLAIWDGWEEVFDDFTAEVEEYIDAGESVVTVTRWRATGKGSGLAIDLHTAEVYEFADGRIFRATVGYAGRAAALKPVGLAGWCLRRRPPRRQAGPRSLLLLCQGKAVERIVAATIVQGYSG
jgi:ketosteroid isomerase-like protein